MLKPLLLIQSVFLLVLANACSSDYYSENDFQKVKKIDTHMHLLSENTVLSELAKEDNFKLLDVMVDVPSYPPLEDQEKNWLCIR